MSGGARTMHGSAVTRDGAGVLLLGEPGAGKSDLALRLVYAGFGLVADDQVVIEGGRARPAGGLEGLLEVRGLGIVRFPWRDCALVLAVKLSRSAAELPRLPEPSRLQDLDLPVLYLNPGAASAPLRVALALDCLQGLREMKVGAFV